MNQYPPIGVMMNLVLTIFGLVGGLSGLLSVYKLARERGASDATVKQLTARVMNLENKHESFEERIIMMLLDIRDRLARMEGATGAHNKSSK